jgi:hypothetical protein
MMRDRVREILANATPAAIDCNGFVHRINGRFTDISIEHNPVPVRPVYVGPRNTSWAMEICGTGEILKEEYMGMFQVSQSSSDHEEKKEDKMNTLLLAKLTASAQLTKSQFKDLERILNDPNWKEKLLLFLLIHEITNDLDPEDFGIESCCE